MKKNGLTLMELLIVVGITLSLLGLILGVVKIGKEAAMKVQCMNNLKQLYLASKMYEHTFGEPPPYYRELLLWQPSYRSLLICPKDPFQGFAAGGWSYATFLNNPHPYFIPHSYSPSYWIAYWIVKGKIKIYAPPEMIKKTLERATEELEKGNYFICQYHGIAISIDGDIRSWKPKIIEWKLSDYVERRE